MKIVSIETFARPEVGLARLTTDSGDWGWGQIASTAAADIVAQTLHRQVAPVVLGRDPEETEAVGQSVLEATLKFPGSYICRALAAVDTAMLDLRARKAGLPAGATLAPGFELLEAVEDAGAATTAGE